MKEETKITRLVGALLDIEDDIARMDELRRDKRDEIRKTMAESGATEYELEIPNHGATKVTFVEPSTTTYDEDGLLTLFTKLKMIKTVTKTVLDMAKVQALVKSGKISIAEIAPYSFDKPGTPYIRVTKKKGGKK